MAFEKRPKLLAEPALFDYALKALGARAQSTGELRVKLRRKAEKLGDVDTVIARLKEYGYLNDRQYAEHYAARRLENEGFGRARVLSDLRAKRVAPALAERAVNATFAATDELDLISRFLARKYRSKPLAEVLADPKGLNSAYRKLRAAGFSSGNSLRVLKQHAKDTELLDSLESSEDLPSPENSSSDDTPSY
jgi:regulatory protein